MAEPTVTLERADGAARITLNRPDSLNAWNEQFGLELRERVEPGVAPAHVVDRKAKAQLAQLRHGLRHPWHVLHARALGQLEHHAPGVGLEIRFGPHLPRPETERR